jgi:hypothetical protein
LCATSCETGKPILENGKPLPAKAWGDVTLIDWSFQAQEVLIGLEKLMDLFYISTHLLGNFLGSWLSVQFLI